MNKLNILSYLALCLILLALLVSTRPTQAAIAALEQVPDTQSLAPGSKVIHSVKGTMPRTAYLPLLVVQYENVMVPGDYSFTGLCQMRTVGIPPYDVKITSCIPRVEVLEDGSIRVHFTWRAAFPEHFNAQCVVKGSDKETGNIMLIDNTGFRDFNYQAGGPDVGEVHCMLFDTDYTAWFLFMPLRSRLSTPFTIDNANIRIGPINLPVKP